MTTFASVAVATSALTKDFGGERAVATATCTWDPGCIHFVIGENGAGKSTLLKMVAGIESPTFGSVRLNGEPLNPHTAREAVKRGVTMVTQHYALFDALTVLENFVIGDVPKTFRIQWVEARTRAKRALRALGSELDLDERVEKLSVGERQRLEIARALFRNASVFILDEPTAILAPSEASALYRVLRELAANQANVIVVTHKLDEVARYGDSVTVLRKGNVTGSHRIERGAVDLDALTKEAMGDGGIVEIAKVPEVPEGAAFALRVQNLRQWPRLRDVSFELAAGEVLGIAGIDGSGQAELVRLLAGLEVPDSGAVQGATCVAIIPPDRQRDGLVLDASVGENLLLGEHSRFARNGWLSFSALEAEAERRISRARVVPMDIHFVARACSGGNQQKLVVERARAQVEQGATVLIAAYPTRGVDVAASHVVHESLSSCARKGAGVVLISSDLSELRRLCHRIVVLAKGEFVGEFPRTATDEELGRAMLSADAGVS